MSDPLSSTSVAASYSRNQSNGTSIHSTLNTSTNAANSKPISSMNGSSCSADDGIVHLIDGDGTLSCTTNQLNKLVSLNHNTTSYTIIGIMGCQSTGKSTLLNLLFHTQFQQMNSNTGRSQTTKGVWLQSVNTQKLIEHTDSTGSNNSNNDSTSHNYIIMDLEGTDSGERGEDRTTFERQTALYALSLCSCVLINMWEHDIGRYTASNYGILKTVFEVNLDIFQPNTRTVLLFVVRDHNDDETPFHTIIHKIDHEVNSIWNELRKPVQFSQTNINELFDIRYIGLPHKVYKKHEFIESVNRLRQQFIQPNSNNYLFSQVKLYDKSVPIDGFGTYVEQLWSTIKSNKALDLPNQREMLAIYRCDEITGHIIHTLQQYCQQYDMADTINNQSFHAQYNDMVLQLQQQYKQQTEHYHTDIVQRKYNELIEQLIDILYPLYKSYTTQQFKQLLIEFDNQLKQTVSECQNNYSTLYPAIELLTNETNNRAQHVLSDNTIDTLQFDQSSILHAFNHSMNDLITQQHNILVNKLQSSTERQLKKSVTQPVNDILKLSQSTMWYDLADLYRSIQTNTINDIKQASAELHCDRIEQNSMINSVTTVLHDTFRSLVEQHSQLILLHMRNQFDQQFRYDSDGLLKHWKPHEKIREQFFVCKNNALAQIKLFTVWRLDHILDNVISNNDIKHTDRTMDTVDDIDVNECSADDIIISESKQSELQLQFQHDIEGALRDAELEQERSLQQLKVPVWAIVAMLFLGFNELMTVLRNPFLLILLLVCGGGIYIAWTLNILLPIYTVVRTTLIQLVHQTMLFINQYIDTTQLKHNLEQQMNSLQQHHTNNDTIEYTDIRTAGPPSATRHTNSTTTDNKNNYDANDSNSNTIKRNKLSDYSTL